MIYWYTGQPGHGKTLNAIEKLLEFKDKGRIVYACNVRKFDYQKTGVLEMTPEQFKDWPNFLPDGAAVLVDEAYEHGMLPKRPPGSTVPHHVEQLAKHRHRGLDFIFVSQSPDKQCDQFVQDLIEEHVHVRRMFGSKTVQLRFFDKYNAHAEKSTPIRTKLIPLLRGKRSVGTYESTEMDTTQRRIPWYFYAFGLGLPLGLGLFYWTFSSMGDRLGGEAASKHLPSASAGASPERNGASATVGEGEALTLATYLAKWKPRVASQPWSAPAYDKLSVPSDPPRLFCMLAQPGEQVDGYAVNTTCACLTEQGTRYILDLQTCAFVARFGQYEPYRQVLRDGSYERMNGQVLRDVSLERSRRSAEQGGHAGTAPRPVLDDTFGKITRPVL